MIDKDAVKSAARGNWPSILSSLGIDVRFLRKVHGPCPACGGKDRFRFDNRNGDGTFICNQCGAGDGFTLIERYHGWTFGEALKRVARVLGGDYSQTQETTARMVTQAPDDKPDEQLYEEICAEWDRGRPITFDDPAGKYLLSTRGIPLESFPAALRIKANDFSQILMAEITNEESVLVNVHRIVLTKQGHVKRDSGGKKIKQDMAAWLRGAKVGCSVKLYEPSDLLGVAEGIETALAAHARFNVPVWATLTAGMLERVNIPATVKKVIIFADNDQSMTGERSARSLERRLSTEGMTVEIRMPNVIGTDFADYYMRKGGAA